MQIAFQLRFSCVSAAFQLRFSSLFFFLRLLFFWSQNIRVPQGQTFGQTFLCVFQLRFSWQKRGEKMGEIYTLKVLTFYEETVDT